MADGVEGRQEDREIGGAGLRLGSAVGFSRGAGSIVSVVFTTVFFPQVEMSFFLVAVRLRCSDMIMSMWPIG